MDVYLWSNPTWLGFVYTGFNARLWEFESSHYRHVILCE